MTTFAVLLLSGCVSSSGRDYHPYRGGIREGMLFLLHPVRAGMMVTRISPKGQWRCSVACTHAFLENNHDQSLAIIQREEETTLRCSTYKLPAAALVTLVVRRCCHDDLVAWDRLGVGPVVLDLPALSRCNHCRTPGTPLRACCLLLLVRSGVQHGV